MSQVITVGGEGATMTFDERQRQLELEAKQEESDRKKQDEEEKKSPFRDFYQVNKVNSKYLRTCLKECPRALDSLLFLFDNMDKYNALVCSFSVFQEALGVSRQTCSKAVKYLKDHGFIQVYKTGGTNVYVANKDLVWNSWGKNTKYCKFDANVILSASEQEELPKFKTEKQKVLVP